MVLTHGRPARHLVLPAMILSAGLLASQAASAATGEILWDTYGIPHIYAPDVPSVVRGLGYAQMENHAEALLQNIAVARGRSAEYFGPGSNNTNVASDIKVRTEGIPDRARRWLADGGPQQRQLIDAFIAGANDYATRHGDTIAPAFRRVLPIRAEDLLADFQNTINFTFMPEQSQLPGAIEAWQAGAVAANTASRSTVGSNGWALAPAKTANGNAILMGNPHLPWGVSQPIPGLGIYQWMESELVVGTPDHPSLNASGVSLIGAPFLGIGYTDLVGWTHTNNTIKNADLYELSLVGTSYRWQGGLKPLDHRTDAIRIRQADGSVRTQRIDIYSSVHGPVIARRADGKALALRVAGLDAPSPVTQYWGMIQARGLADFIHANSALQMPFFNVIYADHAGHIMYLFGGRQPVRNGGTFQDWAGILPGDQASALWQRTLTWDELPRTIDPPGSFVQNSNDPPWTSTFPQEIRPAAYPSYIAPEVMALRPQHGAAFLASATHLTADEVEFHKMSTRMALARRLVPDLVQAALASTDHKAKQAAALLYDWDLAGDQSDADSRGAALFERWFNLYTADPSTPKSPEWGSDYPAFRVEWRPSEPLSTPDGLADPAGAVPFLTQAAQALEADFGSYDVPWGAVHQAVLVTHDADFSTAIPVYGAPVSGSDDIFGGLRIVWPFPSPDGKHLLSYGGDGYVQVVEFAPDGAHARALLTYGNASRPGSSHIADQADLFAAKTLRPAWRSRPDVEAHMIARESF